LFSIHWTPDHGQAASVAAAALNWWQPSTAAVVAGFVILGAAIAWQVGAAAAGGSGISALIGLLIDTTSLAIVGPAILTLALLLVLANSALEQLAPIPVPDGPRH
jgi:hypothetical protein